MPSKTVPNPAIMLTSSRVAGVEYTPGRTVKNFNTSKTTTGTNNPRWRAQVAMGDNATTAYTYQAVEQDHDQSHMVCVLRNLHPVTKKTWDDEYRAIGNVLSQYLSSLPGYDSAAKAQAESAATAAFLAKYRDHMAPFKGGVFLGELGETMRMIRNPFGLLAGSTIDFHTTWLKKLKVKKVTIDDLSNAYLEATYGWAPLCHDIESGLEAYREVLKERKLYPFSAHGFADKHVSLTSQTVTPTGTGGRLALTYQRLVSVKVHARVGGALKAELTSGPDAARAIELSGFRWDEFLPTIWELIPYSFLIDYGTNLAQVVCGWFTQTSGLGWSYKGTEEVAEEIITARPERSPYHNPPDVTWQGTSGFGDTAKQRGTRYTRTVPTFGLNEGTMFFQVSSPSVRQWFNTIILAFQRSRRELNFRDL